MSDAQTKRSVGVLGVVMTMVGLVIGVSIFILPGALAATAGPAVIVSYAIAGLMALFSCVVAALIGAVLPASGASFIVVSRLVSPMAGFAVIWLIIGGSAVAIALVAYGFADYALLLIPGADRMTTAALVVIALTALNLLGIRRTIIGQGIMVAAFMIVLAVFCGASLTALDPKLFVPFMPRGVGPVLTAAVPAFFSFSGFMTIIDIGGEVRNPSRTIPIALAMSFGIVLVVYIAVSASVVGVIPWRELEGVGAPVGAAAARVLPGWMMSGITVAVLAAAATTINALLLGYSRDVLALARVKALPALFERVSSGHGEPTSAVVLLGGLSLGAVSMGGTIAQLATLVVIALLALQGALAVAALRLPRGLPHLYRQAGFRLGSIALWFFAIGLLVFSAGFLLIAAWGDRTSILVTAGWLLFGVVYYTSRRSRLIRRGVDVEDLIRRQAEVAVSREATTP